MKQEQLINYLALAFSNDISDKDFIKLIAKFNKIEDIFKLPTKDFHNLINKKISIDQSAQFQEAEKTLNWLEQENNCNLITLLDTNFPISLTQNMLPPRFLFYRGDINLLNKDSISIVGSRRPSIQAVDITYNFALELSQKGLIIISGMATGIDSAAHLGALKGNASTVAVIGTGIDKIYPAKNKELAHQIANSGLIISEFKLNTPPYPYNFPRRNRIIAGLSAATLVVEASLKSGSLITARVAGELGREVMAVPGSILNPNAKGCHKLIKDGAKLIESVDDILEDTFPNKILNHPKNKADIKNEIRNFLNLLDYIGYDPIHPDEILQNLDIEISQLHEELLLLELDGYIKRASGGKIQRIK